MVARTSRLAVALLTIAVALTATAFARGGGTVTTAANARGRLAFTVTHLSARAGRVTIVMRNPRSSGMRHGIAIARGRFSRQGSIVRAGHSASVTATLKPGTYTFFCPVSGHRAAGMTGTLVVTR